MRIRLSSLSAILLSAFLPLYAQIPAPGAFSNFSGCSHSTCIWVPYFAHKTFHRGPYSYFVKAAVPGGVFYLQRNDKPLFKTALLNLSASVSVSWAPRNTGFSVTWSDGGAIGGYHVMVFFIRKGKVVQVPAVSSAYTEFFSRHPCVIGSVNTADNVQAYGWVNTQNLLIVTSVPPTSDCGPQMGYTEGYIVRAKNGAILQRLDQKQLATYMRRHPQ